MKRPRRILVGAVLAAGALTVAAPAIADPSHMLRADGPTNVHDASLADVNIDVRVVNTGDGRTIVKLRAHGFPEAMEGKTLGAHVHMRPCGADPLASGGHYQNPNAPAGTPLHEREIWLDLDVNDSGRATSHADAPWTIAPGGAGSVVIHALPTNGDTGAAGPRLLCTNVPFGVDAP
ncbi:MAG: superoxide dismutase family protein [Acidimicrobiia bacterium]